MKNYINKIFLALMTLSCWIVVNPVYNIAAVEPEAEPGTREDRVHPLLSQLGGNHSNSFSVATEPEAEPEAELTIQEQQNLVNGLLCKLAGYKPNPNRFSSLKVSDAQLEKAKQATERLNVRIKSFRQKINPLLERKLKQLTTNYNDIIIKSNLPKNSNYLQLNSKFTQIMANKNFRLSVTERFELRQLYAGCMAEYENNNNHNNTLYLKLLDLCGKIMSLLDPR